jgi:hypothetical protein
MKTFKIIDLWISVTLIVTFLFLIVFIDTDLLFAGYFITGAWQIISMIVHVNTSCFTYKTGGRYIYHWITIILLITFPFGSYIILLFIAPFLAIIYTVICYREIYIKMRRPLAMLK